MPQVRALGLGANLGIGDLAVLEGVSFFYAARLVTLPVQFASHDAVMPSTAPQLCPC